MPSTIDNLKWRYATKQYDPTKKLSDEQRHTIMEALRLAPSSFGIQPWKFIHVADPALREKLRAAAWGQSQVTDASDFFVLCSLAKLDEAYVDRFVGDTAKTRNVPVESLGELKGYIMNSINGRTEEQVQEWNARQVYIALGIALAAAAENQIDASPMEGFDPKQFDEILGLGALGLQSRVLFAVGFRSPEDKYQNFEKVRFAKEDVIIER